MKTQPCLACHKAQCHVHFIIDYRSLGKVHGWNFSCEKFHVKIFSSSWVKYANILPYLFNGKNISYVKFDKNILTANFSQTAVHIHSSYSIYVANCMHFMMEL